MTAALQHAQDIIDGQEPHDGASMASYLEDEVERVGATARRAYVSALWDLCGCDGNDEGENIWLDEWKLIHATPEQRARAFVEAMT
jgi:hypothetical protein